MVTLLHLSDLQFGRNHRFGNLGVTAEDERFDSLLERLKIDLDGLRKDHQVVPQAIVASGDLAEWGMKKEFDDVVLLLDQLAGHLGIPRKHIVMVPGNHDINRKVCEGYFNLCEGDGKDPVPPYWPKWKHYAAMFHEFYGDVPEATFTEKQPWTLWRMPELRLVVAGLNSTMVESHRDADHKGWVGEAQLRWFQKELERCGAGEWVRLGVVHHNVVRGVIADDEHLHDAEDLERILVGSLDLLLHGHTHNGKAARLGALHVFSTGSAALKQEQRPQEIPNQYQILQLSAGGIKRWTRRYDPADKRWIGDTRCSPKGDTWITEEKLELPAFGAGAAAPAPPAAACDPTRYLKALREETSHFDVQGLRFADNRAYRFSIEEFYIPLTTSSGGGGKRDELRAAPVPLLEAVRNNRKLLVVGDPGSGKSTFLKRLAFDLCREWREGVPLPVLIAAEALSNHYVTSRKHQEGPPDDASPDWIPLFLGAQCNESNRGLDADYFRAQLKAGACHVLLDGLDEAPDESLRLRLARLIAKAAGAYENCRFTITSRPEGKTSVAGFEEVQIGELEPAAILEFLAKLAAQLYPEDARREQEFRQELASAVNGRWEIRRMTRNPVMLTALAVLQHNNIKLPEKRVDLYGSILGWLSKQRAKPKRLPAEDCLLRLRELALAMQCDEQGRRKQAPLGWAGEVLAKAFGGREQAERFLVAEQADSGIVVRRGGDLQFWHLTFQEYLAACEIAGWADEEQFKLLLADGPRIYRPEWRETVMLYGGLLHNIGPRKVDALVKRLLDQMGPRPSLADRARCVGLIGGLLRDLLGYTVSDPRYGESLRLVMDIFDAEKSKAVPFKDRLAAAEALGQAGDPRTREIEWVTIPESKNYSIGAKKDDKEAFDDEPLRVVNLPPFRISKYPVTVSQYEQFVEDGQAPGRTPERWDEQLQHPNWPVVSVTWHQANAFCEWKGCRLPAEEEWERAARGPAGTKYPWGDRDIDPTRANYDESKIGHPTPVGLYPLGSSPEGALDLIGNVSEWTSSKWESGSEGFVWRGGSFDFIRRYARSSYRFRLRPAGQYYDLGFRVAGGIP